MADQCHEPVLVEQFKYHLLKKAIQSHSYKSQSYCLYYSIQRYWNIFFFGGKKCCGAFLMILNIIDHLSHETMVKQNV